MLFCIHIQNKSAGVPLSVRLQKIQGLSPPTGQTEAEQTTHEKSEVDTATGMAPALPLDTHPTKKGPEETYGKHVLYMKLVASAF